MEFCPTCGMLLQYEMPHMGNPARFFCPTCPYVCPIAPKIKIKKKQPLVKKQIDSIITKDDLANAPETEAICDNCGHNKAAFFQVQIRSADEPSTTFYTCKKCGKTRRED
ncbi:hypothetical protein Leryth_009991 [Lithospermum erythrorhizon]|uniref:DNA-directed RNA polymerase subunit n=1 Tax=Lithospermum erythrorhizon TaxID=34254 RepID=A0AAV3Q7W4_LITER|nr:hypothetical protein Leryth_009991 [Lithospermum erythrorhizon]